MKIQLKHLAPYLPYGLKLIRQMYKNGEIQNSLDLTVENLNQVIINVNNNVENKSYFPLLYPLSYLTKEITVDGNTFVPMVVLCNDFCGRTPCNVEFGKGNEVIIMYADNGGGLKYWLVYNSINMYFELRDDSRESAIYSLPQYDMFKKLFEWYIDFQNLIPQNLAIDKTTIKQ